MTYIFLSSLFKGPQAQKVMGRCKLQFSGEVCSKSVAALLARKAYTLSLGCHGMNIHIYTYLEHKPIDVESHVYRLLKEVL